MNIKMYLKLHDPKGLIHTDDKRTNTVTAYLSVYEGSRRYGGPEEGGWWYDVREFTGVSFPFQAEQDYELETRETIDDVSAEGGDWYFNHDIDMWQHWQPMGLPRIVDELTKETVAMVFDHYQTIYDLDSNSLRSSSPRTEVCIELEPGDLQTKKHPRYE